MIINTQRSPTAALFDSVLTALGWLGFLYLLKQGVFGLLTLDPSKSTLFISFVIMLFNALILILWAKHQKKVFKINLNNRYRSQANIHVNSDKETFHLVPKQLSDVRDSQVTIIHHTDEGSIKHLETGCLVTQALKKGMHLSNMKILHS